MIRYQRLTIWSSKDELQIVRLCQRRNMSCLLFKVDFAKAYNCVDRKFLQKMMLAMGFGSKWFKWMEGGCSQATCQY